jgi:hypothetical protein
MEIFGFDPAQMQHQQDLHHMNMESNRHEVLSFIENLTKEQLDTLGMLLVSIAGDEGQLIAAHYHGILKQVLHFKHGRCMCGLDHGEPEGVTLGETVEPEEPVFDAAAKVKADIDAFELYRVRGVFDNFPQVVCVDCGTTYINLRDRMLREPDDCYGCNLKAKNG